MFYQNLNCIPFPNNKFQAERVTDDKFKFDENGCKFAKVIQNIGKRRNCSLRAISLFPTMFPKVYSDT